jgi:DNA-binding Lrp family transcriptional regulator
MAKTSKKQIDKDMKRTMAELERNSNESLDALAKLEKSKAIWGYTAVIDNERRSLIGYTLMLKRSMKPIDEKTLDAFTSQETQDTLGVTIESLYFVHGEYDWILSFTASDIKMAKRFYEMLLTVYPGFFSRLNLLETLVAVRDHHVMNPNAKKLKEFL